MAYNGLGAHYDVTFSVLGKNITVGADVPIEQAAADAVNAALPQVLAQIPQAVDSAVPRLTSAVQKQIPGLIEKVLPSIKDAVSKEIGRPIKLAVILSGVTAASSVITLLVLAKHVRAKG